MYNSDLKAANLPLNHPNEKGALPLNQFKKQIFYLYM